MGGSFSLWDFDHSTWVVANNLPTPLTDALVAMLGQVNIDNFILDSSDFSETLQETID